MNSIPMDRQENPNSNDSCIFQLVGIKGQLSLLQSTLFGIGFFLIIAGGFIIFFPFFALFTDPWPPSERFIKLTPYLILLPSLSIIVGFLIVLPIDRRRRRMGISRLVIGKKSLSFPLQSKKSIEVNFNTLQNLYLRKNRKSLLLYTEKGAAWFSDAQFKSSTCVEVYEKIIERIKEDPDNKTILERLGKNQELSQQADNTFPVITITLCILLGIFFFLEHHVGALKDWRFLVWMGGNAPALVQGGEIYRLFSANFLHANFTHFFWNFICLFELGFILERLVGSYRFLLLYLISAFLGSVSSTLFGHVLVSVGASTALFGILGSFGYLHWKYYSTEISFEFKESKIWLISMLVIIVFLPFYIRNIDWAAHVGGFLGGLLVTFILYKNVTSFKINAPVSLRIKIISILLALIFAFNGSIAIQKFLNKENRIQQTENHSHSSEN
jgi:rhomboid protease GluP